MQWPGSIGRTMEWFDTIGLYGANKLHFEQSCEPNIYMVLITCILNNLVDQTEAVMWFYKVSHVSIIYQVQGTSSTS